MPIVDVIPLHETAQEKYLNYALSVITSRALPDIRDGLKPVQRRILYAMFNNLRLLPEGRFRKSATVVGEVIGKYHPHGDVAIYDAMVRMAQDFSLRYPLVDGHGNFGSLDGDSPAAMRYTEAKLRALAVYLLKEIKKRTVEFRPNFDGSLFEPVVLPAQFPNLLINGATGIAVGMATNIPPHNLNEVIDALIALSKKKSSTVAELMQHIKGPDFPTGGRILNTPEELLSIYEKGEGPIVVRGEYKVRKIEGGKRGIIIHSIPYAVNKSDLIEKIAEHIREEKVPQLVDIRDESTEEIRIVMELRRGADPETAMTYLFKYTPLQTRFHVNLTCLVPTENPQLARPEKVNLKSALRHFLDFRLEVLTRRLQYDLEQLEKRIHILKGFAIIFNALDEAIKIIRASRNKADAAQRLMHRFRLDEIQTDAILETKLYRLSQLEIDDILKELEDKEKKAAVLRKLLDNETARRRLVREELKDLKKQFGDDRRTDIAGPDPERAFSAEDYIVSEDVLVMVTRDGWVKRQRSYSDISSIRVREGDQMGWILGGATRCTVCFFTNFGKAYTIRIDQLPSTTGYGVPVQKLFDFSDKEAIVGVVSCDPRVLPKPLPEPELTPELFTNGNGHAKHAPENGGPYFLAVSDAGFCLRLSIQGYMEPSTKNGRLYMRLGKAQRVLGVEIGQGDENVCIASWQGRALIFPAQQVSIVKGASKGVVAMRLEKADRLIGYALSAAARQGLEVKTSRGRSEVIRPTKFEITNRGNKGRNVIQRGSLQATIPPVVETPLP